VPLFSAPFMTLVQETVDPDKHGRVFSYVGIVMALAAPIGMSVFGPLADVISVQLLLVVAGALTVVVVVVAIALPSGRAAIAASRAVAAKEGAEGEAAPDAAPASGAAPAPGAAPALGTGVAEAPAEPSRRE
jgi:DHA3 family macrolide efflux protein-like MFS transporter